MPHRPKPPAISVAPSKRSATASSALATVLSIRVVNDNASASSGLVRYSPRDDHAMPIVTFTTDFGAGDGYAGAMKGVVLSLAPQAQLVDITHGVPPQDVAAGAVALAQAAPLFPPGTIHVAVVDPGVGGERADILVEAGGSCSSGPTTACCRWRRGRRAGSTASKRRRSGASRSARRSTAATCSRPTAGRLAAGARAADAGPISTAMVELARRRCTSRAAWSRGR